MNPPVTIVNRHPRLRPAHRPQERLAQKVFAGERKRGTVDIILAGSGLLRTLSRRYRKKNKATDVLSFPFGAEGQPDASGFWGEVYINLDFVHDDAKRNKITMKEALALRIVHGLLHLFGFGHEDDYQMTAMAKRERRYLKAAGFSTAARGATKKDVRRGHAGGKR